MATIVETHDLTKVYGTGEAAITALNHANVCVEAGEFVAVMGPSGCGKSTLLHLIGGLDRPTSGQVVLDGHDLGQMGDTALTELRRRRVGFVFQLFNLIPILGARDNAALPLLLDGVKQGEANARVTTWLTRLGLGERLTHRPDQLSGGERQRVAITRALATEPALLLADEPTGNLDTRSGDEIAALLRQTCDEWGQTVLMVTHDPRIAAYADRIIFLKDGSIIDETRLAGEGEDVARRVQERMKQL